jgi:hypothetical protein
LAYHYHSYPTYGYPQNLKHETLAAVEPWVNHGLEEAEIFSLDHALREAAAISYLMGKGYNPHIAHKIVESWWHC